MIREGQVRRFDDRTFWHMASNAVVFSIGASTLLVATEALRAIRHVLAMDLVTRAAPEALLRFLPANALLHFFRMSGDAWAGISCSVPRVDGNDRIEPFPWPIIGQ